MNHDNQAEKLRGIIPVIPTPFNAHDEVDLDALGGLIGFAARAGASAVCLPAYGSEYYKLSDAERREVVQAAVKHAAGRIKVAAQANHPSSRVAAEFARAYQDAGADIIAFAIPRQFAIKDDEILRYCESVAGAVELSVLVQDFNPGGASIGAEMAARLTQAAGNIRTIKLEEPLMGAKVRAIREATQDRVGVFTGWGGMYLLELMPDGIAGAMPGLSMCDLFVQTFDLASRGQSAPALEIFSLMLPLAAYSLQNMELFHHCEKRLLQARGLLEDARVREPQFRLDANMERYLHALIAQVLALARRLENGGQNRA